MTIRGERTWAIAVRSFYASQRSELNFPISLGNNGPNSERKRDFVRTPPNRYGPSSSLSKTNSPSWIGRLEVVFM